MAAGLLSRYRRASLTASTPTLLARVTRTHRRASLMTARTTHAADTSPRYSAASSTDLVDDGDEGPLEHPPPLALVEGVLQRVQLQAENVV
jgi:hypothetical protein